MGAMVVVRTIEAAPLHLVQFYRDPEFLCASIAERMAGARARGDAVLVLATEAHWRDIARRAGAAADDTTWLDATAMVQRASRDETVDEAALSAALREAVRSFARRHAGRRAWAFGELVDVLWRAGARDTALRVEELWNDLIDSHDIALVCGYSLDHFDAADHADAFHRVCGAHTHVRPAESFAVRTAGALDEASLREIGRLQQRERALEGELARRVDLEESLRAASAAKDEFLTLLGHELRNPLAPIVTALQLMQLRLGDVAGRERAIIGRQVEHLVRLVDDLLDVARLTRGSVELDRRPVELGAVVARAIEQAAPLVENPRHRLDLRVARSGLVVLADEHRLAQAVFHLLSNAARYTPRGGTITVTAAVDGDEVALQVSDTGIGIEPQQIPALFDQFVRGRRAADGAQGGLGLGLAIVNNLVALHGGSVAAYSDGPGTGSHFVVRLPVASTGDRLGAGDQSRATEPGGVRVLVVDDNTDAAELLAEMLRAVGHDARAVFDGPSALREASALRPHVGILDIGLPGMDGYELARRMRAMSELPGLSLIALTGYGQDSDRRRALASGFDEHVVKPVDCQRICAVLAAVTARHQLASRD